jgi:methylmalonyl-CoA mutase
MGLQGMINDMLEKSDYELNIDKHNLTSLPKVKDVGKISRYITILENQRKESNDILELLKNSKNNTDTPIIGITGTGGAGKSSLVDELIRRFLMDYPEINIGIISVDPSKRKTGGALLGDRIRMNSIDVKNIYMRSMATREANLTISAHISSSIDVLKSAGFDLIILETSGIGQSDTQIVDYCNIAIYVMTPEFGAPSQLEKIDMLDYADIVSINKSDKKGAIDAQREVKKQYQRNNGLWDEDVNNMPVFLTQASHFFDTGVNDFYKKLKQEINSRYKDFLVEKDVIFSSSVKNSIISPEKSRYLSEISKVIREYNNFAEEQSDIAQKIQSLKDTKQLLQDVDSEDIDKLISVWENKLTPENKELLSGWDSKKSLYKNEYYIFKVRDKEIKIATATESLSHNIIPKVALPKFKSDADILKWLLKENLPGEFPFAAGVFQFKREYEDPTRMFAGEGSPERTNKRFHYLAKDAKANRLSTAYDSVTLYGENPALRPDIYGKIGNAGVSIATLDDSKKLYSGFNLCHPLTSVSMTINGPAPVLMAMFLNTAIDQQCELYIKENNLEKEIIIVRFINIICWNRQI